MAQQLESSLSAPAARLAKELSGVGLAEVDQQRRGMVHSPSLPSMPDGQAPAAHGGGRKEGYSHRGERGGKWERGGAPRMGNLESFFVSTCPIIPLSRALPVRALSPRGRGAGGRPVLPPR